jgi:CHAT domain-containing protein
VVIAAGGALGSVPFAALPVGPARDDGEPWLIRRVAVSQVPSASAWLAIQRMALADRPAGGLLAWGDPAFDPQPPGALPLAPSALRAALRRVISARSASPDEGTVPRYRDLPALPETRDELLAIAKALGADPSRDLFLGTQATRESVMAANASGELAQRRVIVFATHGLMAGDLPKLDQPALALTLTPDGDLDPLTPLLNLDDVLGLRLNADWVVLSACNTAAADGRAEEAMSGLARGFFYAGARSVLVTHWAVETESAKLLTTRTFEHFTANPYAGKAESLRQAMLSVMAMPKYQHPAFWAPYALVGDGAR